MPESELKPCPFCGSADVDVCNLDEETSVVACDNCNANGGYFGGSDSTSPTEAIAAWNTRPSDWQPITPTNLPKVGKDELGMYIAGEWIISWYAHKRSYAQFTYEYITHFRALNPPAPSTAHDTEGADNAASA